MTLRSVSLTASALFLVNVCQIMLVDMHNATLNLTMVSYGLTPPTILSSIPLVGPGFDIGLEKLNRTYGYNVDHLYLSPKKAVTCSDLADYVDVVSEFYYTKRNPTNPFILIPPGCDDLMPLGKLAREWNVLMLTSGLSYEQLRNRRNYPTTINNGPMQLAMFAEVFVNIFSYFSWTSIGVLLDTGAMAPFFKLWPTGLLNIVTQKKNSNITLYRFEFDSSKSVAYSDLLIEVKKVSRVVILSSTPKIVRKFMIQAAKMGMTNGEYVYFAVEPLRNNRYFGNLTWQYYDSDDLIGMEAFRSLKQLAPCYNERLNNDPTLFDQLIQRSRQDFNFTYPKSEPAVTCSDLADYVDVVSEFYYTKRNPTNPFILIPPGCDDLIPLGKLARVVILSSTPKIVRKFMIQAAKMGMTNGEYVYFAVEPLRNNRYFGNLTWQYYDSDDLIGMEAFRSLKQLAPCYNERLNNDPTLFDQLIQRSRQDFNFTYPKSEPPNAFVIAAHESTEMLGMILNHTLNENPDLIWDGQYLASQFLNRTFTLEYEDAFIDDVGERRSNYCISAMNISTKLLEATFYYDARRRLIKQMVAQVDWGNADSVPPKNRPRCGYLDNDVICLLSGNTLIYLVAGLTIVMLFIILIGSFICCNRRIKRETAAFWDDWWRVDVKLLEFMHRTGLSFSKNFTDLVTIGTKSQIFHGSLRTRFLRGSYALYKGIPVWTTQSTVTNLNEAGKFPHSDARKLLWDLKGLIHLNIVRLIGITVDSQKFWLLSEYCAKGSLNDILHACGFELDVDFKCSFLHDLIMGLKEIHASPLKYHGFLVPEACLIDARFTLKIGYLGFERLMRNITKWSPADNVSELFSVTSVTELVNIANKSSEKKLPNWHTSQRRDLASFGRIGTFLFDSYEASVQAADAAAMPAPQIDQYLLIFKTCKDVIHHRDLCANDIIKELRNKLGERNTNLMTRMQNMLDKYANRLENLVLDRTKVLLAEQENCDKLLRELLPTSLVEKLRKGAPVKAELYESATLYFGSLFGFQVFIQQHSPIEIAQLLNSVYTALDLILPGFSVFKMETIADSYLVVSGIPERNENRHAKEICNLALRFRETFQVFTDKYGLQLRSGINSGPCAAGIVGFKCPRFCIFGDTVNTASRMESHGLPSKIHVSAGTAGLMLTESTVVLVQRGIIFVKGKGECITYWLEKPEG
ncbi:atrial natriuretic peptide receptor 1-like [Paramacrobiotus metropolitanus]|uniref:atrial natriuretic peptide receptor 1-like n=1 Tax=Paramacrobiotus metropolitanus TaxID=2943436 RepID=UPI002445A3B1|nr:atrial natriuretic peptide receptor 1-like [Paramacrobiotus metropolitanus]